MYICITYIHHIYIVCDGYILASLNLRVAFRSFSIKTYKDPILLRHSSLRKLKEPVAVVLKELSSAEAACFFHLAFMGLQWCPPTHWFYCLNWGQRFGTSKSNMPTPRHVNRAEIVCIDAIPKSLLTVACLKIRKGNISTYTRGSFQDIYTLLDVQWSKVVIYGWWTLISSPRPFLLSLGFTPTFTQQKSNKCISIIQSTKDLGDLWHHPSDPNAKRRMQTRLSPPEKKKTKLLPYMLTKVFSNLFPTWDAIDRDTPPDRVTVSGIFLGVVQNADFIQQFVVPKCVNTLCCIHFLPFWISPQKMGWNLCFLNSFRRALDTCPLAISTHYVAT